jgi:hypothetical protein
LIAWRRQRLAFGIVGDRVQAWTARAMRRAIDMRDQPSATLLVKRTSQFMGMANAVVVLIDDEEIGRVKIGGVDPGRGRDDDRPPPRTLGQPAP